MVECHLKILDGLFQGHEYLISERATIGRGSDNHIQLADELVSRHHAEILPEGDGFVLRDTESANGTFVNGQRIQEATLSPGDTVKIGETTLKFQAKTPSEPATDADTSFVSMVGEELVSETEMVETEVPVSEFTIPVLDIERKRLDILLQICQEIPAERNFDKLLDTILGNAFEIVPAHRGAVLLKDEVSGELTPSCTRIRDKENAGEMVISSTVVNRIVREKVGMIIADAARDKQIQDASSIRLERIRSAMCVPIMYHGEVLGAIYVDSTGTIEPFRERDLQLLIAMAGPAATAISNARYLKTVEEYARRLERSRDETLAVVANTIEGRDHYTVGHTWRVTKFAMALARHMGWDEGTLKEVEVGGVLHDIGKIAVDDAILRKPAPLDDEEFAQMKIHCSKGASMLKDCRELESAIPYVLYHHERYDGRGYPFGLAGEEIPREGRLLAIADCFDAMTSNRPYRKALPSETAIAEIEERRGEQFDPGYAEAFVEIYKAGKISSIMQDYAKGEMSTCCPFCSTFIRIVEQDLETKIVVCTVCHHQAKLEKVGTEWMSELV